MTKEKSLIKIEEYRQLIEKLIPYLKVKGVSMSFESFVIVEHDENSWSRIIYHFDVQNVEYLIFGFSIRVDIKTPHVVFTPTVLFEYQKNIPLSKKNTICGKMVYGIYNETKSVDTQLQEISEMILKRKLLIK